MRTYLIISQSNLQLFFESYGVKVIKSDIDVLGWEYVCQMSEDIFKELSQMTWKGFSIVGEI